MKKALWDIIKMTNICITGNTSKRRENEADSLFKKNNGQMPSKYEEEKNGI